jgi:multiple sugar transport system ATP-binding protein
MASVTWDHAVKRFGDVVAVNDLCITVEDGEFLILLGPSGCGKTTALRLLAGLEELTAGNVHIGNRCVTHLAPKDRDIAMVFQSYALYPHMSVEGNLGFGLKMRGVAKPEIARRVRAAATLLAIDHLLDRKPRQLSGGQRQRVAVGRAIAREPQVFLFDEPLSNLDAKLRVQTRAELIKLHQRLGTTSIYVTHDQVEAMTMGSRIAILRDGVLQQLGTPRHVYDRPANLFVAGFIGSPAMNFLSGRLTRNGSLVADVGPFRLSVAGPLAAAAERHDQPEVVVGFRPEHVVERTDWPEGRPGQVVSAQVEVVEPLGSETYVYLKSGEHSFVGRFNERTAVRAGDRVEVVVDLARVHLFDPATERRLLA